MRDLGDNADGKYAAALFVLSALAVWSVFSGLSIFADRYTDLRDFRSFYLSAIDYWHGSGFLYEFREWRNLNAPHASLLLFSVLALFDIHTAAIVWFAISAVLFVASLALIQSELQLPAGRMAFVAVILLGSPEMHHNLRQGQVAVVLLFVVTLAWRAARRRSAGCSWWLALAASLKPPVFAIWILTQDRREAFKTILLGCAGLAIGVALIGLENWRGWIAALDTTRGITAPWVENIGLQGMLAKAGNPRGYVQPAYVHLVAMALGALALVCTWRARRGSIDRAWLLWGLLGILLSPIAWSYYLLALTGPLVAWGEERGWPLPARASLVLLAMPYPFVMLMWMQHPVLGAVYSLGVITLWATVAWNGDLPGGLTTSAAAPARERTDPYEPI